MTKTQNAGLVLVGVSADTPGEARARRLAAAARCEARRRANSGVVCPCGKALTKANVSGLCVACFRAAGKPKAAPCRRCGGPLCRGSTGGKTGLCLACLRADRLRCHDCRGALARRRASGRCRACRALARQSASARPPCRHCKFRRAGRARGLCNRCYGDPLVKSQYQPQNEFSRQVVRGGAGMNPAGSPPAAPTATPPGSEEKIAVLAARAARGESLHHPADNGRERVYGGSAASAARAVRHHRKGT